MGLELDGQFTLRLKLKLNLPSLVLILQIHDQFSYIILDGYGDDNDD